ncbi:hypothetical protein EU534_00775 [Candidatus Heimdallarchaeota archaeon]|nr:MAG: hypothetical protein EU534_00775 [Candidatus Heimdallarchaeota archaeon]
MNEQREVEEGESRIAKRFSRGIKAFGRRYFTFGLTSFWRKRKYDRELRNESPALQLVWIAILIILLVVLNNENKVFILYIFVPFYFLMLFWEIWIMGAPENEKRQQ